MERAQGKVSSHTDNYALHDVFRLIKDLTKSDKKILVDINSKYNVNLRIRN